MGAILGGSAIGLGVGALTGLADVLFRYLHPAIGFSHTSVLAVLVLYGAVWAALGGGLGIVWAVRGVSWGAPRVAAGLIALSLLVLFGGYVNVYWLPALLDPRSLLFDAVAVAITVVVGMALARWLPEGPSGAYAGGSVLLAALLLVAGAWISRESSSSTPAAPERRRAGPDLLVVLFDALRPDHTSVHGYPRRTTPTLETIADDGAVYLRGYAPSSWTKPSISTLFTGVHPASHGTHTISSRLPEAFETLPSLLRHHGYRTGVFAENSFVSRLFGFGRGVERLVCSEPDVLAQTVLGHLLQQLAVRIPPLHVLELWARGVNGLDPQQRGKGPRGLELHDAFLSWLDEIGNDPYFAYVHYMKPHAPYIAPAPYDGRFGEPSGPGTDSPVTPPHVSGIAPFATAREVSPAERDALVANYDERILFGDALFGRILDGLRRRGRLDRTALLVVSDHGEEFGEHGLWDHGHSLQEGVTRVLFMLRYPSRVPAGARVEAPVRLLDVAPTVLDLAGLPSYPQFDGRSVLPLLETEEAAPRPVLAQLVHGPDYWSHSLVVQGWKLVQTRDGSRSAARVFDLHRDPGEDQDLAATAPLDQLRERMAAALQVAGRRRQEPRDMIVDRNTLERLRALGYLE